MFAALHYKRGASFRLLSLIDDSRWQANLSVPLVLEYEDVLKRPAADLPFTSAEVDDFLDFLCANASQREIFYLWRPALRDPKDDLILELAVESGCHFIITVNVKDFAGSERFGVKAQTPRDFLRELGELP